MEKFLPGISIAAVGILIIAIALLVETHKKLRDERQNSKRLESTNIDIETDLIIQKGLLTGIEHIVANGWNICYSHSVGLCAKRQGDKFCVPVEDAMMSELTKLCVEG